MAVLNPIRDNRETQRRYQAAPSVFDYDTCHLEEGMMPWEDCTCSFCEAFVMNALRDRRADRWEPA